MVASQSFLEMRRRNAKDIINIVRAIDGISRAELAKDANLSKATVSSIVDDLLRAEILFETGTKSSMRGRPSIGLTFNSQARYALGICLDDAHVGMTLCDLNGKIFSQNSLPVRKRATATQICASIAEEVTGWMATMESPIEHLCGIGVAAPGPLVEGELSAESWWKANDISLSEMVDGLKNYFKAPFVINSNLAASAVAELKLGGTKRDLEVLVRLGHEIRSAIAVEGKLISSLPDHGGELGHIAFPGSNETCSCGRKGCINASASTGAILRSCIAAGIAAESVDEIVVLAMQGNVIVREIIAEATVAIAYGIAVITKLLHPETIVIAGPLAGCGDFVLESIQQALLNYADQRDIDMCKVVKSSLQSQGESLGIALEVLTKYDLVAEVWPAEPSSEKSLASA